MSLTRFQTDSARPEPGGPDLRNEICCRAFMLVSARRGVASMRGGSSGPGVRHWREYDNGDGRSIQGPAREDAELIGEYDFTALPYAEELPYAERRLLHSAGDNAERYHVYKAEHYFPDSVRSPMIAIMLERKHSYSHTRPWHAGACSRSRSSSPRP